MTIVKRSPIAKGSEYWIRILIEKNVEILNDLLRSENLLGKSESILWVAPQVEGSYVEYRDADFLRVLNLSDITTALAKFWPRGGPQWDALGTVPDRKYFLIEAKSHIGEIDVGGTGARHPESLIQIRASLLETQLFLGARTRLDWSAVLYQTANRLAHLYWLRQKQNKNAFLLNVYFVGDPHAGGASREQWMGAIRAIERVMGLSRSHPLRKSVASLFVDVATLAQ